tara:strand:- start:27 stop:848 length:822 start_codon:yes stop_codon:yes gene_type:complete
MDVPNIMHSARIAAGYKKDGDHDKPPPRFSYNNIVQNVKGCPSSGFDSRTLVECIAVTFDNHRPEVVEKTRSLLELAGFKVVKATQKYVKPPVVHRTTGKGFGVESQRRPRRSVGRNSQRLRHLYEYEPRYDDSGVVDLKLTNIVWDKAFLYSQSSRPLDTIVIISGDGDYAELVERLKPYGFRIEVFGPRDATSSRLVSRADMYVEMSQYTPAHALEADRFLFFEKSRHASSSRKSGESDLVVEATDDRFDPSSTGELFISSKLEEDIASIR